MTRPRETVADTVALVAAAFLASIIYQTDSPVLESFAVTVLCSLVYLMGRNHELRRVGRLLQESSEREAGARGL